MERANLTASAIIKFAQDLEERSMRFYEELARRFGKHKETFLVFAKDSKKNGVLITRTYQETITDALEACFGFEGLDLADYPVDRVLTEDISCYEVLQVAINLEEAATSFYIDAAERSESLLATIPSAFKRVAKKRGKRKVKLQVLHDATAN